jgi:CO/xanthine dehydrogenase Mo-binding subunit
MEHIGHALGMDPVEVRRINLESQSSIPSMLNEIRGSADWESRKLLVETFNKVGSALE